MWFSFCILHFSPPDVQSSILCVHLFQVKAAFTRAYNKEVHLTPYSLQTVKKGRRGGGETDLGGEEMDQDGQESEDEGLKTDAMIKVSVPDLRSSRNIGFIAAG